MASPMSFRERTLAFGVPDSEVAFSREEYQRRLNRVRDRMANAGIDLLYVTNPDHICYLSGYQAEWFQAGGPKAWSGTSGIAVHVDHDHYLHFENEDEKLNAGYTTWADHLMIMPEHDISAGFSGWVVGELAAAGWIGATVGMEFYSYRPNPADSAGLRTLFEDRAALVVDGTDMVAGARLLKSDAELEVTREAARIGDIGLRAAIDSIRADLGAIQNRFDNTISSNQINSENLSAANSRIRDADFAAETANLTKMQILQQAGVAMLAQANSLPQLVLSLLQ